MKASILTSIKAKIISLMLLGIAGMVISTATNTFFDHQKNRNIEIGRHSQRISQIILESMMLEELFIGSSDNELLPRIAALDEDMNHTLEAIKTASAVPEILKAAADIAALNTGHDEIFHTTSEKLIFFNQTREKFKKTDDQLIEALQMVINQINAKETAMLIDDGYIPSEEKLMREKMKDFFAFDSGKTVNILNLFIFADVETYQKRSLAFAKQQDRMIDELTNILGLAKSDYLNQAWGKIYGLIQNNREQEKLLFETWTAKQKLLQELKNNGSRIQAAAAHIVNLTKENIEQSKRSSKMIVTAISLLGLAAMIFVGVMIIIAIVKPINTTVNMLKDIAEGEGDLTSRLESKNRDEIAELAHWFNLFIGKVQTIINEVAAQVSQLNSSAAHLSQLSAG
ncbi:MAG: methyl-accepting chemotaxis protein, partial [Deltaproteobacteria bacterium]|nr:methyl-accepting chemotaxis protein [Deltaproteobacteria bacterium]